MHPIARLPKRRILFTHKVDVGGLDSVAGKEGFMGDLIEVGQVDVRIAGSRPSKETSFIPFPSST